jgi:pimeloyl-ACP methyl ester carboxylesterase
MLIPISRKLVRALPPGPATRLAVALSTRSLRPAPKQEEQRILASGKPLRWGPCESLRAWEWGTGPLVVLLHGWGGHAGQMAFLASALAEAGFRAVAVDMRGHGRSAGARVTWSGLIRDAALAAQSFGTPYAMVAHSAGGLATMAARRAGALQASRYVCIAAPSHPFPAVQGLAARLSPPARVMERYQDYLASEFDSGWAPLADGASFSGAGRDLLLVYDETDKYVPHAEGDRIQALCPQATLVKVRQEGHTRMLGSTQVAAAVASFLAREPIDALSAVR